MDKALVYKAKDYGFDPHWSHNKRGERKKGLSEVLAWSYMWALSAQVRILPFSLQVTCLYFLFFIFYYYYKYIFNNLFT